MANDKILATFRIDPEKWEAFKALASSSGKNASAFLLDFVDSCLDTNQMPSSKSDTNRESVATNIDVYLDSMDKRIDERLEAHLDSIEHRIDDVDKLIDKRIDEVRSQLEDQLEALRGKLKAR